MGEVTIDSLTKVYASGGSDRVVAVNEADFTIGDGELVVMVGPSGSGKSTLLRCIAGLEEVTEGSIFIDEENITNKKPRDRDIAMVFQNFALYPHLDARGNMAFGLKMRGGYSQEEIDERVEEAAEMMGIQNLLSDYPRELSGGQQQRVSLGRAIVRDPAVFLMDEPLASLDAKLRSIMRTELQRLQDDLGVTTVYVTHDQTEAMTMGDRIVILDGGEIQQIATPLEAYYEPENMFVAGFIGSPAMNFIETRVTKSQGETWLENGELSYLASEELAEHLPGQGTDLVLGIRPEDIEVSGEASENRITVEIDVTEPLGREQLIYFHLDGEEYIASAPGGKRYMEATTVSLNFPEDRIHIFDKETEKAILNSGIPEEEEVREFA